MRRISNPLQNSRLHPEPLLKIASTFRFVLAVTALFFAGTVGAHHSAPVNFDTNSSRTVSGKLIKTKWANPHSQMQIEVTAEDGGKETWLIEMDAINTIRRMGKKTGFTTDDFVVGETITVGDWLGGHHQAIDFRTAKLQSGQAIIWQSRLDPDLAQIRRD